MRKAHTNEFLTVREVADLWAVSPRTVQRYITNGQLKAVKLPGGMLRIRVSDANDAIAEASA